MRLTSLTANVSGLISRGWLVGSASPGKEGAGKGIRLQADNPNSQTQTNKNPVAQGERFKRIFMDPTYFSSPRL